MSRYRKVLCRIWEDDKFPYLSQEGRLLFLYHLTSPRSTPFLLYVEGRGSMMDALRMTQNKLARSMTELAKANMAWYADDNSNLIFLPNALLVPENSPASENAVKSWGEVFQDIPRGEFLFRCVRHWQSLREGIANSLTDDFLNIIPTQEQEQLQEQDTPPLPLLTEAKQKTKKPPGAHRALDETAEYPWPSVEALMQLYNAETADELSACEDITPARAAKANEYLAMFPEREYWVKAFRSTRKSMFLQGKRPSPGHKTFIAKFDWFLQRGKNDQIENVAKAHAGDYGD